MESDDRRQYHRWSKEMRVELSELSFSDQRQRMISTRCLNVSAGGLLLESPQFFQTGDKVRVKLFVPRLNRYHPSYFKVFESSTDQNLMAVAEVVRVEERVPFQKYRIGIQFLDVYEDDWQALFRMIQSESGQEPDHQG